MPVNKKEQRRMGLSSETLEGLRITGMYKVIKYYS